MTEETNVCAIIQARMSSKRLPGKVLKDLCNKTVIQHIHDRLQECRFIDKIIIATSNDSSDDVLVNHCAEHNMLFFQGSLNDVLNRFSSCADKYHATHIVRITGDCPLIDPKIVDSVICGGLYGGFDYYGLGEDFPDGLDCTFIRKQVLVEANNKARLESDREHVGPFIERNDENNFKLGHLRLFYNTNHIRLCIDDQEDFDLVKEIYENLYNPDQKYFDAFDVLKLLNEKPELLKINEGKIRNEGLLESIKKEKNV